MKRKLIFPFDNFLAIPSSSWFSFTCCCAPVEWMPKGKERNEEMIYWKIMIREIEMCCRDAFKYYRRSFQSSDALILLNVFPLFLRPSTGNHSLRLCPPSRRLFIFEEKKTEWDFHSPSCCSFTRMFFALVSQTQRRRMAKVTSEFSFKFLIVN